MKNQWKSSKRTKRIIRKLVDGEKIKANSWRPNPTDKNMLGMKKKLKLIVKEQKKL